MTNIPDDIMAEHERSASEIEALRADNARLRAALAEAVDRYGQPGGPWNVPSDPGGWLHRAREALRAANAPPKPECKRCGSIGDECLWDGPEDYAPCDAIMGDREALKGKP